MGCGSAGASPSQARVSARVLLGSLPLFGPLLLLAPLLLLGTLGSRTAVAQSDNVDPLVPSSSGARLPDILSEGTLRPKARLWLSDKDGNPFFVPDESYHDYLKASGKTARGMPGLPPVALEKVDVDIVASGDIAHVEASFDVLLTQEIATSVHLQFGTVQLSHWSFSGEETKNLIQAARDEPGWRWVLLGEPDTSHTATLKGVSRIAREMDRRSLRVSLPTAPCTIHLKLPSNAVDVRVRNEDVLQRTNSVETDSGKVNSAGTDSAEAAEFDVRSAGGEFTVSWRDQAAVAQIAAIKGTTDTKFEIADPNQPWSALTTLRVRWYGQEASNRVRIQLPQGGQWRAMPDSDFERYRIFGIEDASVEDSSVDDASRAFENHESQPPHLATSPAPEPTEEADTQAMQLVLENFDVVRNATLEIELEWEWQPVGPPTDTLVMEAKVPSPIIHGVDEHEGTIDCIVSSAYAVVFQEGEGARLNHQGPLMDGFPQQQLQFKFDRQPFDLSIAFRREQSLPTVRPTYLVHVDRNKLMLTMWFDCSFDTNQPQMEIGLILDEWLIQENTARVVSDSNDPFSSEGEVLRVQQQVDRNYLIRGASGDISSFGGSRHVDQVWRLVAERSWTAEDKGLYFQVPQIIRGQINGNSEIDHGSGALLVSSDSNVLLNWQESAGTGLQRDSFSTEYQPYVRDSGSRKPLAYRFQSSGETPVWAGKAEMLPRQVSVDQLVDLEVVGSQLAIRQNLELQVANEALTELRFAVRKDAGDTQPPQILINGNLVSSALVGSIDEDELDAMLFPDEATAVAEEATSNGDSSSSGTSWQVYQSLGSPDILGATRVTILSSIVWKNGDKIATVDNGATAVNVPLAQLLLPPGTRRMRQDWTLRSDLQVETVQRSEEGYSPDITAGGQRLRTLSETQKEIPLILRPRRLLGGTPIRIGKSWLQSFVSGRQRRERFVVQVESNSTELQLKLPKEANIREGKVKVSVDGFDQLPDYDYGSDTVKIPLTSMPRSPHVVEISYFMPDSLSWVSQLSIAPPQILGAEQADRFYWQLITPSVQHLAWSPSELTAEWTWRWSGLWWERASELTQRQLEEWINTAYQEPPPASANSYVMSGRGMDGSVNIWILSRFVLWFPVGMVAIALSFAVLNYRSLRKPGFVFALAAMVAGLATIWPDMAVLAGQTAVLSLGLVVLVWVIQAAVDSRVRRRSVFTTRPSTFIDRSDQFSVVPGVRTATPAVTHVGSSVGANGG